MNYNYLRYFSVLAEVEHYTLAAARLGISQPSLSSAIHNLENELGGVQLFEKTGRNIRLTEEGRFYQAKVDAALAQLHSATRTLQSSKTEAPVVIRLGFVSGALDSTVIEKLLEYSRNNKRVRFHLTENSSENLKDLLRQEKLDMAIVDSSDRDRSLHFRKLRERDCYAALPLSSPLAKRTELEPREVLQLPIIAFNDDVHNSFGHWATGKAPDMQTICTVNTVQAALHLVAAGMGNTIVPDTCIHRHKNVAFVPLNNWHQALYMCSLYDKWLEPLIGDFREVLISATKKSASTDKGEHEK